VDHICNTRTTASSNFLFNVYPVNAEGYNRDNKISRQSGIYCKKKEKPANTLNGGIRVLNKVFSNITRCEDAVFVLS